MNDLEARHLAWVKYKRICHEALNEYRKASSPHIYLSKRYQVMLKGEAKAQVAKELEGHARTRAKALLRYNEIKAWAKTDYEKASRKAISSGAVGR